MVVSGTGPRCWVLSLRSRLALGEVLPLPPSSSIRSSSAQPRARSPARSKQLARCRSQGCSISSRSNRLRRPEADPGCLGEAALGPSNRFAALVEPGTSLGAGTARSKRCAFGWSETAPGGATGSDGELELVLRGLRTRRLYRGLARLEAARLAPVLAQAREEIDAAAAAVREENLNELGFRPLCPLCGRDGRRQLPALKEALALGMEMSGSRLLRRLPYRKLKIAPRRSISRASDDLRGDSRHLVTPRLSSNGPR